MAQLHRAATGNLSAPRERTDDVPPSEETSRTAFAGRRLSRFSSVRQMTGRSFTLVEMLVVIAVILTLASLLMPALSSAMAAANTAQCGSNLKQVGFGTFSYLSDNYDYFPSTFYCNAVYPSYTHRNGAVGTNRLNAMVFLVEQDYLPGPWNLGLGTYKTTQKYVTICPTTFDEGLFNPNPLYQTGGSYGVSKSLSKSLAASATSLQMRRFTTLKRLSDRFVFSEGGTNIRKYADIYWRHQANSTAVTLMGDCHVGKMDQTEQYILSEKSAVEMQGYIPYGEDVPDIIKCPSPW